MKKRERERKKKKKKKKKRNGNRAVKAGESNFRAVYSMRWLSVRDGAVWRPRARICLHVQEISACQPLQQGRLPVHEHRCWKSDNRPQRNAISESVHHVHTQLFETALRCHLGILKGSIDIFIACLACVSVVMKTSHNIKQPDD